MQNPLTYIQSTQGGEPYVTKPGNFSIASSPSGRKVKVTKEESSNVDVLHCFVFLG